MSESIQAVFERFLTEDDWPYQQVEDSPLTLRTNFKGDFGQWACYIRIKVEEQQAIVYSVLTAFVPEARRSAMAEFLTRANFGLTLGNFEMDFTDGEVRYKTSLDLEGAELTTQMVNNLIYANVFTMDKYLPGIMVVMYSPISPYEAILEIERGEMLTAGLNGNPESEKTEQE